MSEPPNRSDRTDGELLRAAAAGDETAFGEFCVRALPTLLRVLRARCRRFALPADLADDVAQETLLRALRELRTTPSRTLSLGWLLTVGRNRLQDEADARRRQASPTDDDVLKQVPAQPQPVEALCDVFDGLERLAIADREILELILFNEWTFDEAAAELGIGRWAAYKRYERALRRLRELVGGEAPGTASEEEE